MELECDLSSIQSEELLRKMWQQSEDINRKKEIRSQLYKLRESRLRDLYQFDTMSDNRVAGFGKDLLAPSHGESLVDQSFQSLKSKEIRDSMSPTEMKFHSMTLNNPNTTGWNVQSSSEVSPDGRGFRAETLATTDGVENINGGTAEFKGRNEQRSSAMHEGDDNNFVKKASESSKTHLQEKVVVGDENAGRTEVRTSSSTSTSSSKVIQSSTTDYDNGQPVQYLVDSNRAPQRVQEPQYRQTPPQYEPQATHDVRHLSDQSETRQHYDHQTEQYRQNRQESNTSQNVQTNETHEQNKRYVDMDKASPEYQRQVQHLMSQPGEIISNTVEYPKPNVKMITTVKRLPDGTIVRNKRYETEETNPGSVPSHASNTRQTTSNQTNQRRESQTNQQPKNYGEPSDRAPSERYRHPNNDIADNVETKHYTHDTHSDNVSNVETKYSTVKTSNRKFSTETTSEHVQEYDDHHGPASPGSRTKPVTNAFSTHGFPSVRPNKPTQEFATDRPNLGHPSQNFTIPRDALIPVQGEPNQNITERRIPTKDGEVIIISSEKRRNVKQQTNSERIIETDIQTTDDNRYQNVSDVTTKTSQDFSTHGFPSVSEPFSQPKVFPDNRQLRPLGPGYSPQTTQGAPGTYVLAPTSDDVVVSSQKSHTSKHSTNTERIIETEIVGDNDHTRLPLGNFPVTTPGNQGQPRSPIGNYTVTTPGAHYTPNTPNQDFSTHGFPSVKSPTKTTPDYSPQGFPSARSPTRATPGYVSPRDVPKQRGSSERPQTSPVKTSPSTKKSSTTIETTERVIQKEKEVDAAHRAFAASLRSCSPAESPRRDSTSTDGPRHTPRSSVSSTKTFRRDMREGSHDSAPGSETSRMSTSTVTRQTPPKTVGGRTVVTKQTVVTSKNGPGSTEILNVTSPRGSKSPSPGKSVTTTTTTRTITSKALPKDVPKPDNHQHITTTTTDTIFPINHEPLTITKTNYSENKNNNLSQPEVIEEPCIKKHMSLLYPSAPKNTIQKREASPRSSPAPSSRSSPYPSKSKSPLGEDDQSVKSYTSRPLSPSSSTRSPKPIGFKDVPNSSGQRPTTVVSDERRTVDRDTVIEETSTVVDDYLEEDIDSIQNVKRTMKQMDPVPKRSPVKITSSPHQVPTTRRDNSKRVVDRPEEPKRPKPNDQTIQKQPTRPKSGPTTSATLIVSERKAQTPQKVTPKTVGPTRSTESPRKPQPKSSERPASTPRDTKPKYHDDEHEDVPNVGYRDHVHFSETDDEPITSNVRQIIVQTTNKKTFGEEIDEFEYDDISETGEIPNRNKSRPNKIQPIRNQAKPEGKMPKFPAKETSTALIVNERKGQTSQKVTPRNIGPTRSTESPRKPEPKPSERLKSNPKETKPKYYDDGKEDQYVPRGGYPAHVTISEIDDKAITSNVCEIIDQTTNKKTYGEEIDEFEYDDISETSEIPHRNKPRPNQVQPIRSEVYPNKGIEAHTPQKFTPKNIGPTNRTESPHKPQPKPSSRPITTPNPKYYDGDDQYVPKSSHPDRVHFSESDDEPSTSNVRETTETIIEETNRKTYGEKIDEFEYDKFLESSEIPNRNKPQPKNENKPRDHQATKVFPQNQKKPDPTPLSRPDNIPEYKGQKIPKDRSPDRLTLSETEDEFNGNNYRETTEITVKTTNKHSPTQRERVTLEDDHAIPKDSRQEPKKYEPNAIKSSHDLYAKENIYTDIKVISQPRWSPTITPTHKDTKPTRPSEDNFPLETKDEPKTPSVLETSAITIQTTTKKLHSSDEKNTQEPRVTLGGTVHQPKKYEPDFEVREYDKETDTGTLKTNKRDVFKSTVTTHVKDKIQPERTPKSIHEQFIEAERSTHPELPDGAYISKSTAPVEPTSPTFKKKGVGRRDTFEDRCRQILGMESYGDTPGTFKTGPDTESTQNLRKTAPTPKQDVSNSVFESVKIEDCGDEDNDDEPLTITSVKKTIVVKKDTPSDSEIFDYNRTKSKLQTADKKEDKSFVTTTEEVYAGRPKGNLPDTATSDSEPETSYGKTQETNKRVEETGVDVSKKPETRYPTKSPSPTKDMESLDYESVRITSKRVENSDVDVSNKPTSRSPTRSPSPPKGTNPLKKPTTKSPSSTEPLHFETKRVTSQRIESSNIDVSRRPTSRSPSKPSTTSYETRPVTKTHPSDVKGSIQTSPKHSSPGKEKATLDSPKRKPDSSTKTTTNQCVRDENIAESTTIKDRLRSSTRKERIPKKPDQVDAGSSPETSPSRYTARRRSSNISVNTEIIIEHTDSETVNKKTESKTKKQTDAVYKEIIDSTCLPEKMPKKIPVTERKESAPVHRVTRKDKDSKMSRSTSENIIKVKKPEATSNLSPQSPKLSAKTPDHRRPNKCFATKTINLSTTDRLLTSEDMENVVIDIQQAKSSREPSPDKIVPTPVPAHLDTGKPRYPDVVQEPEDEPRRKPVIKNIPIFEEEHNNYVGCHITEVNIEKSRKTIDCSDYRNDEILNTPVVEAPLSLDYPQSTEVTDDECLLSVHDKVSKFQHIAKEVTKPKSSTPFNREFDDSTRVPDDDECLLTVDEKVDKFIKTAQNLTKEAIIVPERDTRRPIIEVTVQDLDTTECTYAPVKLGPSAPQRSPELVRHISRNISRQSDVSEPSIEQDDYQRTYELHEKETVSKRGAQELVTHHKQTSTARPRPVTADYNDDDGEELIPHTASHTTILEERRQKNILARPSVFDNDKNKTPIRKTQPKYVSPVKDSEKSTTINKVEVKSRAKPETPKHSTLQEKTITTSTTSRRKQQSPQRPNPETDCDYRRSSVETGVSNNTTKQTKLYTTSGPKKSPQSVNKKPDRQSPLRTNITKNVKQERDDVDDVDDDDAEFEVVPNDRAREVIITTDTAIRSTTTKSTGKTNVRKEPTHATNTSTSSSLQKKMKENPKSSTCSSPSKSTKAHLVDITERSTQKHNTTTTTKTIDSHKSSETNESFLEKPTLKKPPHPQSQKTKITTTDSVAARRSLFENNATTNTRSTTSASSSPGRRPSYMDHTKSSLEHIRRDSLELNKTNYTRKPSVGGDDDIHQIDRDTQVKFDVPQKTQNPIDSDTEDVDVENIFDLVILERMLETVTSYELRRRIRAQIRLVKKNLNNVQHKKSETITTTKLTNLRDRSISPVTSVPDTGSKTTTKKQYFYREEERTSSSTHTSPERTQRITTPKVTRTHSPESKKSVSPSDRSRGPPHKPAQVRVCSKDHERSQSPDSTRVTNKVVTSRKHYDYRNEREEQVEHTENVFMPSSPTAQRSSRKSPSPYHSPERHDIDSSKSPSRKPTHVRVSSRSPDNKVSSTMKTNARYEQSVTVKQPKRTPVVTKGKPEQKTPVWADRKNVLKTPASTTPKKPSSVTDSRTSSLNKTVKSTSSQSQKHITNKSTYVEDDCITSSYGIGPTDENGLPLFGIRALKKKKPTSDPCETTEELTGYVVEEKYYSDNKSKPLVERKEIIYSTNAQELDAIKEKVKETTIRKSQRGEHVEKSPPPLVSTHKTSQKTTSVRSSPEDSYLESSTKNYVRRGSVKEMSEKFIHKESSSSVSEKSNNYPKAGLILRTNSRRHSRDNDAMEGGIIDSYETRDSEEDNNEGVVRVGGSTHSNRILADSESECESVQTQREFKKITSSTSSSSRSFLNTKGEEKIITNVTDVLDRMRNADNVVEDGDTAEDQEARALLNKFLGASIIMKGVESTIPINETKLITTTSTSSGKQPMKHEVKTTRVTKTIKSGSSSSPVTETTCDIEEIWDEEILKQLLDQAKSYEERRKIRSRLRELMADRPEKKDCQAGTESAAETTNEQSTVQRSDSSASEYEEIIEIIEEEVSDSSDSEEIEAKTSLNKETAQKSDQPATKVTEESRSTKVIPSEETDNSAGSNIKTDKTAEDASSLISEAHTNPNPDDKTDSSEKGESGKPALQGSMHQQKMLQINQQNFQKAGVTSTYSKTPGGNTPKIISSDRSMHAPNNKSSSSAQYSSQTPTVTVTAGRADNTSGGRDISSSSKNNSSDVVGSKARQLDRLGVPQKEDSGTESGEDLRLIAAGLRDQLQMKSDSNIIEDVTCALSRLESSLKEGKDISVDTEKRKALLALVARLQDGLTSPEKLAEIAAAMSELDGNDVLCGETSSPEADAHRSGKQRFAKRRSRVNRHTVGVSREELADARRYMEDMLMMENISLSTTPEANTNSPPQWFPLEKNASSGAILVQQPARLNCFLGEENVQSTVKSKLSPTNGNKRRPVSGDFSVSFEPMPNEIKANPILSAHIEPVSQSANQRVSPDNSCKYPRFSNKKLLMKRANTIDLAKAKRFGSDFDTDSDAEDKSQLIGLKRAVHPTVKKRVQNVVPPFEPKTENDRKFLAFINKQSDKPGLGWTSSRSVSNWSNKFGNLKNSFEIGATTAVTAAKPPQVPGHQLKLHQTNRQPLPQRDAYSYTTTNQQIAQRLHQEAERQAEERRRKLEYASLQQRDTDLYSNSNQQIVQRLQQEAQCQAEERRRKLDYETLEQRDAKMISHTNQQIVQRSHQEAERQADEHRRKLEYERMKYERRESDKLDRQRQMQQQNQQQERLQKERMEREYYERHIRDHDNRTQHVQHNAASVPLPMPINEFKHAPQSVFRPIDSGDMTPKTIYKPIPQMPTTSNTWQPPSPNNNPFAKADNSFITSPPPSSKSPIGLPWAAKPAVDASSFKNKANRFEERSRYDNYSSGPMLQRHNSLRMPNIISGQNDDFKKRPSLPNTTEPYGVQHMPQQSALPYLPPPTNVSYIYDNRSFKPTYLSYPCLPTAVSESNNYRSREDSLTNPQAVPLVLTTANPSYCPAQQSTNQQLLPRDAVAHFDIASPVDSALASPSGTTTFQNDYTDDDIESDSLLEYRAVSKVMGKPQSQTAVTVGRRTGHVSDDEVYGKNSKAAKSLLSTMKSIGSNGGNDGKRQARTTKRAEVPTSPKICLSPDGRSYQAPIVEPLFPDVTSYEPNRKINNQPKPTSYSQSANYGQPAPRNQSMMYKSMENISTRTPTGNPSNAYVPQQPSQQHQLKPYISETQASYVVTYPTEDTTDDEEVYRHRQKVVPDSLPLRRTRNISETSTASSNTASITYANNLPSPNTSWTSNPIIAGDCVGQNYYNYNSNDNQHQHFIGQPLRGEEPIVVAPMSPQYLHNQSKPEVMYTGKTAAQYQQTLSEPKYQSMVEPSTTLGTNITTGKSQYTKSPMKPTTNNDGIKKAEPSKPPGTNFKSPNQLTQPQQKINYNVAQPQMTQPATNYEGISQKPTPSSKGLQNQVASPQKVTPKPQPPKQGKPDVQPSRSNTAQQTPPQKIVSSKPKQSAHSPKHQEKSTNKKSLANMRKSMSEDCQDIKQVSSVREQTTSIKVSQKAVATTATQHHNGIVSTDTRRQSLGNTLNGQHREESETTLTESQQLVYKSSAPSDTPDIVKSSLPKDDNQPILKKFGPPQRHHYMPNSYKSPVANTPKSTTSAASTTVHTKSVEITTNKSILKTSQQTATSSKPIIVENPATPQPDDDYIPRNIVFNNVHAFTSMSRRQDDDRSHHIDQPVRTNKLCKSESWKQIINLQNQNIPQPTNKLPHPPINELRRTKSGHSLAMPKMYEAAIDKTEISEKQNIMAAYFAANKSPIQQEQTLVEQSKRSVINRTKTSEKISASRKSLGSHVALSQGGLTRSATMPHIANLNLLDESNVEDAFEQLMMEQQKSSTSTTEKTETKEQDGAVVTTTTKVTTRTVAGGSASKTASPFTKFKQLDGQNSQQSAKSPTTPSTPGSGSSASPTVTGNAPIFKFTDPALNARAATVKDQLLQWCQSKTKEYENVQITNFSACWVDGLAFCALIHHFLPDAFDYSQLTPENRRKNFELAFTVADEKAGIAPLLDVEDMVVMKRPDWKCVFVYVQSIYRRFRNCQ